MADLSNVAAPPSTSPMSAADELELTRMYRERYPDLVAEAKDALGSELEHYSGKIAQQGVLDAWPHRAEYSVPGAFDGALHDAIRAAAAVQRQKHAALHQRGGARVPHLAPLSTDDAVAQLVAHLHHAPIDHEAAVRASREVSKHHAAEHVQHVARTRSWKGPAIGVVVLAIAIVGGSTLLSGAGEEIAVKKAIAAEDARTLSAARGQRGNVDLADGTKARIGSDSRLRMPRAFGTTMRTAEVEGTVSFTVAAGQPLPFTILAGNAIVTATGTHFTVRAFPEEQAVVVGVEEGSVSVRVKDGGDATDVAAGQAVRITPDGAVTVLDAVARDVALAWVRDSLVFTDTPARVVLDELARWFSLSATFADSTLGARPVTMRLGLESSGSATAAFAKAAGLTIGFDKQDKVVLSAAPQR
ncbi:FecR domain-containing protein [Gemmatimonas sp.]|uniref:FecR family protein n=1 Tax=Gemmatimonas sp. TaxID=1962908 RepID=UPI00286E1177|nr:FecR domain-containing protein [Gemmatimonas sp.]